MVEQLSRLPEWLVSPVLGAVLAALGYVSTLLLKIVGDAVSRSRKRRARLVELYSQLGATQTAFKVQTENRDRLQQLITQREASLREADLGFDRLFAVAYPQLTPREQELHAVIRSITENTLHPLNTSILAWLKEDDYFRAAIGRPGRQGALAQELSRLEAHLLLWLAKYRIWIPDHPEHALVYMADEDRHGTAFPHGIEAKIRDLLRGQRWFLD